ncbi:MAG: hypothetical protein U9Q06_04085 [Nanoarchaeota archaeon]|nr:hypothetical protein [Nanoarchaeota archaeon]
MVKEKFREISLEKILSSNKIILVDTSFFGTYYLGNLNGSSSPESPISKREIRKLINAPNTFVIPQIIEEIKEMENGLNKIQERYSEGKGWEIWKTNKENHKMFFTQYQKPFQLFQDIQTILNESGELIERMEEKVVRILDGKYEILVEMIKELDSKCHLKRKTREHKSQDYEGYSDVDEKLIASAFYLSLTTPLGTRPAILTADKDFINLLGVTPRIMGADVFYPENYQFKNAVLSNCPRLHVGNKGIFSDRVATNNCKFDKIIRMATKRDYKLEKKFKKLWERFHNLPEKSFDLAI